MRTLSRFPTLFILLAFVCFFSTTAIAEHNESDQESHWVGRLYGSTEIWGLGYSHPWARSAHHVTVSNESNTKAWYLYEFKASVLQAGLESKHPTSPFEAEIDLVTVMIPGHMNIDLRKAHNIEEGELFTLSCYTRVYLRTKFNGRKGWRVTLEHDYFK